MSAEDATSEGSPPRGPPARPVLGTRVVLRRAADVAGFSVLGSLIDGASAVVSTRVLGAEARGLYAVALTVGLIVASLACLGAPTVGRVLLARGDELELHTYLSLIPVHAALGGLAALALNQVLVVSVLNQGSWSLSMVVGATAAAIVTSIFLIDGLHAFGDQRRAAAVNALGSASALILVLLLSGVTKNPALYLVALGLSQCTQAAVAWIWLRRHRSGRLGYSWQSHRRLLRSGLPALPYQVSTFATFRLDRYIVGAISGVAAVGIYSVAATLSEATRTLPLALGKVLVFGRSSGQVARVSERRARYLVLAVVWAVLAGMTVAAPLLVRLLFGEEFLSAVGPLRVLLLAEGLLASWFIDNHLLVGSGRFGAASATTVVAAVVVVLFDLALIPSFGLIGAGVASVLGYGAAAAVARHLLRRGAEA